MQYSYEKLKKVFEKLNIAEKISKLNLLKHKLLSNYNKKCEIPSCIIMIGLIVSIPILAICSKSILCTLITSSFTLFYAIIGIYTQEKLKPYFYKKTGYTYYQNELKDYLKNHTIQADIINYFNVIEQSKNKIIDIKEENKTLKTAFIENNYILAIKQIELILNKIENMYNYIDSINKENQKIKTFEKMIGAISLDEEIELEFSGSFKKYL